MKSAILLGISRDDNRLVQTKDVLIPAATALLGIPIACFLMMYLLSLLKTVLIVGVIWKTTMVVVVIFAASILYSWAAVFPVSLFARYAVKRGWIGIFHAIAFGVIIPNSVVVLFHIFNSIIHPEEFDIIQALGLAVIISTVGVTMAVCAWVVFYFRRKDLYQ